VRYIVDDFGLTRCGSNYPQFVAVEQLYSRGRHVPYIGDQL